MGKRVLGLLYPELPISILMNAPFWLYACMRGIGSAHGQVRWVGMLPIRKGWRETLREGCDETVHPKGRSSTDASG
jgi:hypothetical protein